VLRCAEVRKAPDVVVLSDLSSSSPCRPSRPSSSNRPGTLYDRPCETILWANLRIYFLNQKLETTVNPAYNPEHNAALLRVSITYIINDAWKTSLTTLCLHGPPASLFGRYAANDQLGLELIYAW